MVVKLCVLFFAAFLAGFMAGEVFVTKSKIRKNKTPEVLEDEVEKVTSTSKQEIYN